MDNDFTVQYEFVLYNVECKELFEEIRRVMLDIAWQKMVLIAAGEDKSK